MLIQDKATWDADIDKRLALMSTLGIDCVSLELPDTPSNRGMLLKVRHLVEVDGVHAKN